MPSAVTYTNMTYEPPSMTSFSAHRSTLRKPSPLLITRTIEPAAPALPVDTLDMLMSPKDSKTVTAESFRVQLSAIAPNFFSSARSTASPPPTPASGYGNGSGSGMESAQSSPALTPVSTMSRSYSLPISTPPLSTAPPNTPITPTSTYNGQRQPLLSATSRMIVQPHTPKCSHNTFSFGVPQSPFTNAWSSVTPPSSPTPWTPAPLTAPPPSPSPMSPSTQQPFTPTNVNALPFASVSPPIFNSSVVHSLPPALPMTPQVSGVNTSPASGDPLLTPALVYLFQLIRHIYTTKQITLEQRNALKNTVMSTPPFILAAISAGMNQSAASADRIASILKYIPLITSNTPLNNFNFSPINSPLPTTTSAASPSSSPLESSDDDTGSSLLHSHHIEILRTTIQSLSLHSFSLSELWSVFEAESNYAELTKPALTGCLQRMLALIRLKSSTSQQLRSVPSSSSVTALSTSHSLHIVHTYSHIFDSFIESNNTFAVNFTFFLTFICLFCTQISTQEKLEWIYSILDYDNCGRLSNSLIKRWLQCIIKGITAIINYNHNESGNNTDEVLSLDDTTEDEEEESEEDSITSRLTLELPNWISAFGTGKIISRNQFVNPKAHNVVAAIHRIMTE